MVQEESNDLLSFECVGVCLLTPKNQENSWREMAGLCSQNDFNCNVLCSAFPPKKDLCVYHYLLKQIAKENVQSQPMKSTIFAKTIIYYPLMRKFRNWVWIYVWSINATVISTWPLFFSVPLREYIELFLPFFSKNS